MFALVYPAGLALCIHAGGAWTWALVPFNILVVPAMDHLVRARAPDWKPSARLQAVLFAEPVFWGYTMAQLAALIYALHAASRGLSAVEYAGLVSSTGIMTGTAGITAAHELIHRRKASLRALGLALLAMVFYMHFRIQHTLGHHRRVGTDQDPGSARLGESFPAFFARALGGGISDAWSLELARVSRLGYAAVGIENRMLHYGMIQASILCGIGLYLGWTAAAFFVLQSLMAVHLLEAVNYVQHYGLRRDPVPGIPPRPFLEQDAWDSDYRVSELLVFNLTKHADHHSRPGKECAALEVRCRSRKLPYSFFLMVFLALFPPVWRRLMDPKLEQLAHATLVEV